MDIKNIEKISNDELEHYLFTPDGIGKIGKKIVFDELFKRRKERESRCSCWQCMGLSKDPYAEED